MPVALVKVKPDGKGKTRRKKQNCGELSQGLRHEWKICSAPQQDFCHPGPLTLCHLFPPFWMGNVQSNCPTPSKGICKSVLIFTEWKIRSQRAKFKEPITPRWDLRDKTMDFWGPGYVLPKGGRQIICDQKVGYKFKIHLQIVHYSSLQVVEINSSQLECGMDLVTFL